MLTRIMRSPLLSTTLFLGTLGLFYLLKIMLSGELSSLIIFGLLGLGQFLVYGLTIGKYSRV